VYICVIGINHSGAQLRALALCLLHLKAYSASQTPIILYITNILFVSGGKKVAYKIQDGDHLKLKTNIKRPNIKAKPGDKYYFQPNLDSARQCL
jgi:hypothetical protein